MFDGAHLVAGFEDLNPANTLWDKHYHLWANVDTEADRYLEFERWWNGYYLLTAEEIHFIVDQLFVGNRAQRGQLVMNDQRVDLKAMKGPIVVFASHGDNITPPSRPSTGYRPSGAVWTKSAVGSRPSFTWFTAPSVIWVFSFLRVFPGKSIVRLSPVST